MRYEEDLGFDKLILEADLSDASATIYYVVDGEEIATQYQTADARHVKSRAFELVLTVLGSDYYADPSSQLSAGEQLAALVDKIKSNIKSDIDPKLSTGADLLLHVVLGKNYWNRATSEVAREYETERNSIVRYGFCYGDKRRLQDFCSYMDASIELDDAGLVDRETPHCIRAIEQ